MSAGTSTSAESKWYALRVVSGKERKIRDYIENEVKRSQWDTFITQILVPTEKVYKVVNGKKTIKEKNFFPGYILIEAIEGKLNGDIIQIFRNITGVIHFLGKEIPTPLRKSEVNRILGKVDEVNEQGEMPETPFYVGEPAKVMDGPFNGFSGVIDEVMADKKKLKVIVKIFGRNTPVELNYLQVEKE